VGKRSELDKWEELRLSEGTEGVIVIRELSAESDG